MATRIIRSEQGDVSTGPICLFFGATFAIMLAVTLIAAVPRDGLRGALVLIAVIVVAVPPLAIISEWRDRRRWAKPFEWVRASRHEATTVALPSGASLVFDGVDVTVDPLASDSAAIEEAWRLARPDRLPAPLNDAAYARWAAVLPWMGKRRQIDRWLSELDRLQRRLEEADVDGAFPR